MDLLLQKMHSDKEFENRTRPWIVRNKLVGLLELSDGKYPCVSLFSSVMEEVPRDAWKLIKVKGQKNVLVCSKTLTFVSAAKAEFHFDKTNTVVTHAFIDCIRDDFKPDDKKVFWKHQMELFFQLINSHYEGVKELDEATVEEITEELQNTDIIEKTLAAKAETNNPEEEAYTSAADLSSRLELAAQTVEKIVEKIEEEMGEEILEEIEEEIDGEKFPELEYS